jgi:hypothetical protein
MWGILSRGVNPYTHEGLFIDAFKGVEPYIKTASEGKFADVADSYAEWATTTAPKGSGQPGAGAMHNLNAFGKDFLTKMGTAGEDGVTPLQHLHDLLSDPTKSGRDIRREFAKIGEGVGIDNKVMSFILLATGRDDVMVIDRIQLDNLFNDGRFNNMNIWDGVSVPGVELPAVEHKTPEGPITQPKRTIKFSPSDEGRAQAADFLESSPGSQSKNVAVTGSSLAEMTYGAKGLLAYEAIEDALGSRIHQMYTDAGRPQDASIGGWHWDTWVAKSNQEASHGSLEALLEEAKGNKNPLEGVYSRQGDYQTYAYGAKYFRGKDGPYFLMPLSDGSEVHLSVAEMNRVQADLKDVTKGAVPVPTPFVVNPKTNVKTEFANTPEGRQEAIDFAAKLTTEARDQAKAANPNLQPAQITAIKVPVRDRKFSVETIEGKPWYEDNSINRERVDKLINDAAQRTAESRAAITKPSQGPISNGTGRPDDAIRRARDAAGFNNGLPSTYGRVDQDARGRVVSQNPPQFNAPIANVYEMNPNAAVEYQKGGHSTPPIYELSPSETSAQVFQNAIKSSKEGNRFGAAVYVYDPKDYAKMRLFMTPDGTSGFALKGDDIVSVFNIKGGPNKNISNPLLDLAIAEGGRKLDAYDTVLPKIYGKSGFKTTSRMAFVDGMNPDWNYKTFEDFNKGKPDVVHMVYDPRHDGGYDLSDGKFFKSEEDAVNEQTAKVGTTNNYLKKLEKEEAKKEKEEKAKKVASIGKGKAPSLHGGKDSDNVGVDRALEISRKLYDSED